MPEDTNPRINDHNSDLEDAATQFLRENGQSWSGRDAKEAEQAAKGDAMRKAIRCPFGGYSRARRNR